MMTPHQKSFVQIKALPKMLEFGIWWPITIFWLLLLIMAVKIGEIYKDLWNRS